MPLFQPSIVNLHKLQSVNQITSLLSRTEGRIQHHLFNIVYRFSSLTCCYFCLRISWTHISLHTPYTRIPFWPLELCSLNHLLPQMPLQSLPFFFQLSFHSLDKGSPTPGSYLWYSQSIFSPACVCSPAHTHTHLYWSTYQLYCPPHCPHIPH